MSGMGIVLPCKIDGTSVEFVDSLNKHLMPYNPENLILLDNSDWENHVPKRPIVDEKLQIEDNDISLVENGEQQKLDIDDNE